MDARISVIIPLYNRRSYIRPCIDSVLRQTIPAYEIIVIDDGSTDNSRETIQDLIDNKQILYFYQHNQGISMARNAGIAVASGNYLAFLDSDDLWLPTKLEKQINHLQNNKTIEFVHNDATLIGPNGDLIENTAHFRYFANGNCFDDVLQYCGINMSSVLVSKTLIELIGHFDRRLQGSEDYEFFMRCSLKHNIGFVDEKLTLYRRHPGGASADRIEILLQAIKALDVFCDNTNADRTLRKIVNRQKGKLYFLISRRYFYEMSNKPESRKLFYHSLRHCYVSSETIPLFLELIAPDGFLKNLRWYKTKLFRYLNPS